MKEWIRPVAGAETFEANDSVAACLTVTLQCEFPGKYDYEVESKSPNSPNWPGSTTQNKGYHSICGNPSTSFINGGTGNGYETKNGVAQYNRPITDVLFGTALPGNGKDISLKDLVASSTSVDSTGTYYATWTSTDGSGDYWYHKGIANVSNIDSRHPNRS